MPTVVGEMMPSQVGVGRQQALQYRKRGGGVVIAVDDRDQLHLGVLRELSSCFMYSIQEFWLVAVASADRMAIWP